MALGYGLDDREFDSWQGLEIFLFTTAFRPALGPTQPPIQSVTGTVSLGVKRAEREDDHSPLSSAEVKNAWSYTSAFHTSSWRGYKMRMRWSEHIAHIER
jgi:hypothetical protein